MFALSVIPLALLHPSIIHIAISIVVVGVLLWLVNAYIPMQDTIKKILNGVVVIALVVWLLQEYGLLDGVL